jgi:hypothetical protein
METRKKTKKAVRPNDKTNLIHLSKVEDGPENRKLKYTQKYYLHLRQHALDSPSCQQMVVVSKRRRMQHTVMHQSVFGNEKLWLAVRCRFETDTTLVFLEDHHQAFQEPDDRSHRIQHLWQRHRFHTV